MYLGSPCEFSCNPKLMHVYCDPTTASCQCDPKHPVSVGVAQGCAKGKLTGNIPDQDVVLPIYMLQQN